MSLQLGGTFCRRAHKHNSQAIVTCLHWLWRAAGLEDEFLFVGRLDNLAMSYLSLRALIDSTIDAGALDDETAIKAVALFDHEEVGSASAQGERPGAARWSCIMTTKQHGGHYS